MICLLDGIIACCCVRLFCCLGLQLIVYAFCCMLLRIDLVPLLGVVACGLSFAVVVV